MKLYKSDAAHLARAKEYNPRNNKRRVFANGKYVGMRPEVPALLSGLDTVRQILPPRVNQSRISKGWIGERHVAGYIYFIADPLTPDRVKGGGSNNIRSRLDAALLWTSYRARVVGYVEVADWRKAERDLWDKFQSVRDGEWYPREVMNRIPGLIRL